MSVPVGRSSEHRHHCRPVARCARLASRSPRQNVLRRSLAKASRQICRPNFPLSAEDGYVRGGRLSATFDLFGYITFGYKLWLPPDQRRTTLLGLQMRLMMQSLLADRFKLKVTSSGLRKTDQRLRPETQPRA